MEFLYTLAIAAAIGAPIAGPTGVELERLVDTSIPFPGAEDPVSWDGPPPTPCGRGVALQANQTSDPRGWIYYASSSGVEVIVDEATLIPGEATTFEHAGFFSCLGGDRIVFLGWRSTPPEIPVSAYEWSPGAQVRLLQSGGDVIDGRTLGDFVQVGGNLNGIGLQGRLDPAFLGEALVVKPFNQPAVFVTDTQVVLPGRADPVDSFTSPQMIGEDLVFRAQVLFSRGLYRWSSQSGFSVVADDGTSVLGGFGTLQSIGNYTVLSTGIAFTALYSGGIGIFHYNHGGEIAPLIIPGDQTATGETVTEAHSPTGEGSLISFTGVTAETAPLPSVFVRTADGSVHRILGVQDQIEGKTVLLVDGAADRDTVAVRVTTTDLEEIIYKATFSSPLDIPTLSPSALVALTVLIAAGGLLVLGRRG